ncbi:5-formyltetrahydrofolate cyclo-ligase [Lentibacillus kapialis]|uniref:5-formyltetrahydrofolate cyclo-ligase n=1 Tax=Lentibacillus kapialis TaxID=340214 RepID=A0A917V023_9BACI|nr:5-formyltetrahydrofolate cyclo-ligase [Lentibacillus kapialis]GGK03346.1 5-formyltetrahydrofolate cyclo-ligase [Lentibacillus kapialis]
MDKSNLRSNIIGKLQTLTATERRNIELSLKDNLLMSNVWRQSSVIGITISHGFEWDTESIIKTAWQNGKRICVPKCRAKEREMDFYKINNYNQLEIVYYNLQEPKPQETEKIAKNHIDLLVVPGLLFDKQGYRIGFGGGYYDRFLTDFTNKKLSLAADMQIVDKLPYESFDIPMDDVITESGFLKQGGC